MESQFTQCLHASTFFRCLLVCPVRKNWAPPTLFPWSKYFEIGFMEAIYIRPIGRIFRSGYMNWCTCMHNEIRGVRSGGMLSQKILMIWDHFWYHYRAEVATWSAEYCIMFSPVSYVCSRVWIFTTPVDTKFYTGETEKQVSSAATRP